MSELERLTHDFSSYRISQQKIRHFVDFENENETKDKKIFTNFVYPSSNKFYKRLYQSHSTQLIATYEAALLQIRDLLVVI